MVELRLSSQLTAKVLGRIGGWSAYRLGHFGHINDDRFNAVAFALNFGRDAWHLVPIENVGDITVNVDGSHIGDLVGCCSGNVQPTQDSKAEAVVVVLAVGWYLLRTLYREEVVWPQTRRTSVDFLKAMVMVL